MAGRGSDDPCSRARMANRTGWARPCSGLTTGTPLGGPRCLRRFGPPGRPVSQADDSRVGFDSATTLGSLTGPAEGVRPGEAGGGSRRDPTIGKLQFELKMAHGVLLPEVSAFHLRRLKVIAFLSGRTSAGAREDPETLHRFRCRERTSSRVSRSRWSGWSRHLAEGDALAALASGHLQSPTRTVNQCGPPPFSGGGSLAHASHNPNPFLFPALQRSCNPATHPDAASRAAWRVRSTCIGVTDTLP